MRRERAQSAAAPMIRSSVVNQVIGAILSCPGGDALLHRKYDMKCVRSDLYDQIPLTQYLSLFEDAANLAQDPFFGARLGSSLTSGELLGPIGFLFVTAPCIRVGLSEIANYIAAWQDKTEIALVNRGDRLHWSYRITDPKLWPRRQDAEFSLAATCAMVRNCNGRSWAPLEVHFEHSRPPGWQALKSIFRAPMLFEQAANALVLESAEIEKPIQAQNASFAPFLRRHIEEMLEVPAADKLAPQVRQIVARELGHGPVSLQTLANQLGMPARTLQRRLADEGNSVRDIVRQFRIEEAKSLLETGRRNINAVSQALGYSDPTAFWRAFKSHEGVSPAAFRERGRRAR